MGLITNIFKQTVTVDIFIETTEIMMTVKENGTTAKWKIKNQSQCGSREPEEG